MTYVVPSVACTTAVRTGVDGAGTIVEPFAWVDGPDDEFLGVVAALVLGNRCDEAADVAGELAWPVPLVVLEQAASKHPTEHSPASSRAR